MKKSFDVYLEGIFAKDYHGADDDFPDSFDQWLCGLNPDDFIKYAEEWRKE